ncbi:unnamed protein product [Protopolystoma xenopodis]|uniref:Uncharacterized protein n=1 Tax=Protopolystoma xenopodis TaxID=117903 RepID=A0A448X4S9_9PLAT|nr:unnamed protein product [Protopolystoma xenopodis]
MVKRWYHLSDLLLQATPIQHCIIFPALVEDPFMAQCAIKDRPVEGRLVVVPIVVPYSETLLLYAVINADSARVHWANGRRTQPSRLIIVFRT